MKDERKWECINYNGSLFIQLEWKVWTLWEEIPSNTIYHSLFPEKLVAFHIKKANERLSRCVFPLTNKL